MIIPMIHNIPIDGEWCQVSDKDLVAMGNARSFYTDRMAAMKASPISYFMPHGVDRHDKELVLANGRVNFPASCYGDEFDNDGQAFLSDRENEACLMVGPNQQGKSYILAAWTGLHVLPMDPNAPVFTENGVKYHEWEGPKDWVVASYSWDNVGTFWERIRAIFPPEELGDYAPGKKSISFGDGRSKRLQLKCGSRLIFLCYTQKQEHWESYSSHGGSFDEQCPKDKWIGWKRSTTTTGDYTPFGMALTGHVLPDRPDTGAGGWINLDLWQGRNDMGVKIGRFNLSVESTPDAIVSAKSKKDLWEQWVNPDKERSESEERAAVARYWGGWEQGSGLVFDEFDRNIHIIPAFKIPKDWTLHRSIDYGKTGTTCCSWLAVAPQGFSVCYRVLYEKNLIAAKTCRKIIEMSGNGRTEVEGFYDDETENLYKCYEEDYISEEFYYTLMDSRSRSSKEQNLTLDQIFDRYGVETIPACGDQNIKQIPALRDMIHVDMEQDHIFLKDENGVPKKGAPRLYFFDTVPGEAIKEFETAQKHPEDNGKFAKGTVDHFIDTCKYYASSEPCYQGDYDDRNDQLYVLTPQER